ncbi:MAG: hypothetical protein LBI65_03700, partial [Candidatus Symbiothrix sp.]|nr:hypothetical protein [Candidatus Symbiothrix sp.]
MNNKEKIEFYKPRNIGERLNVTVAFLKQTWKIILKLMLPVVLPLALVAGYSMTYYLNWYLSFFLPGNRLDFPPEVFLLFIVYSVSLLFLMALPGAIMIKYERGELNSATGWREISRTFFSLIPKTFLILFYFFVFSVLLVLFFVLLSSLAGIVFGIIFFILAFLGILAILPALLLVFYPAYFNGNSAWSSIKTAFS